MELIDMKTDAKVIGVIETVHRLFKTRNLTRSIAESCTGGLLCHYVTLLPGASLFFQGGIIAYSEQVKKAVLGVSSSTIATYGVVGEATALEMAVCIRRLVQTSYGLATTGNLGPGSLEGKARGLVYVGLSSAEGTECRELLLRGDRQKNKAEATLAALRFLVETIVRGDKG